MGKVICFSNTFWESYNKLGKRDQNRVTKTMDELRRDSTSTSLNVHGIEGGKCDKKFLSARVNLDIRIIFVHRESMCTLLFVGHHDEAYEWCVGKYLEKTNFGDEYIYDRILAQKKIEYVEKTKEAATSRNYEEGILSKFSITKTDLIDLGVQAIHAENIILLDEDELLDYIEIFPHRLQEALFDIISQTKTYDEVRKTLFIKDETSQKTRGEFVTMDMEEFESAIEKLSNEIKQQSQSVADSLKVVGSYDERIKNIEERFKKIEVDSVVTINEYSDIQKKSIIENYVLDSNPNMILCSKCRREIYVNAQFCVHCGCVMSEIISDYEKEEEEKKERLKREYISRLSEFERSIYDSPICEIGIENYEKFSEREWAFIRTKFSDVDKKNFYYFYSFLSKLTTESLIKWVEYSTIEELKSLLKVYYTKVCGVGISLEILAEYDCFGEYMIYQTFRIQDNITFKLGDEFASIDIKIIKVIDSMYPQYSILSSIEEKGIRCKKEYIDGLSPVEKYLYFIDSEKEGVEREIYEGNVSLGEEEKNIIRRNSFAETYNEELLENILISLSGNNSIKWHEYSVEKKERGCEGTYVAKINNTGVLAKILMLYKDEKRATIRCTYAFQGKDYCLGDEHRVKNIITFRDVVRASTDVYTLNKHMKEFIEERKEKYEAERLMQEKLAKKRAEEELAKRRAEEELIRKRFEEARLASIPKLDIYSIFETHDIPGLESISLYELFFKDKKKFEKLIINQVVIVDDDALEYLNGLNEKHMSIRQKMYGIENPIIAQLEKHGELGFIVPDHVLQMALDNGYVELTIGNLYGNSGPEYYEIHYGLKMIKSTKSIAVGKKGKWRGSVIESGGNSKK